MTALSTVAAVVSADPAGSVTWADFVTNCKTPGQIALTYSEGPSEATMEMLQTLKEAQARVTFFTNATWLQYMQYAGVTRHAYLDGHLIGMTYRLPSDTSAGHTDQEIQDSIAKASHTIQDLIGVYPKYMKIHESNLKDTRLLNLVKSMGYTLVGFNMDEYDYKYNNAQAASQIAEVYNGMFSKQMDAYGRKASYVVAGYDVPTTGAAAALPLVVNMINTHGYDMVRLDGCTNDKTPYKKDPILNNGFVSDSKSLGAKEYKHGQSNVKAVAYNPSHGGAGGSKGSASQNGGGDGGMGKNGSGSQSSAISRRRSAIDAALTVGAMAVIPALVFALAL
ncbi:hypothetical protein BGZ67_008913 [Mortierella alpina]|nr:hypothetical protein BGZ67_008913 [Mortierella alpina]